MSDLRTKRLFLRKLEKSDLPDIYEYASDEEVVRYLTFPRAKSMADCKVFLDYCIAEYEKLDTYRYGIVLVYSGELIGVIDICNNDQKPLMGFVLKRKHWNNGYMSEAAALFINYLFIQGFKEIYIDIDESNVIANHVINKLGFTKIGQSTHFKPYENKTVKFNNYLIKKENFK